MDEARFKEELNDWLQSSGTVQRLQTKVRAELIEAFSKRRKPNRAKESFPSHYSALNSLVLEHLMRTRCWYTASVFASEASGFVEMPASLGAGAASLVVNAAGAEATAAQKLSDESVQRIVDGMGLTAPTLDWDDLRVAYYCKPEASLLSVLLKPPSARRSKTDLQSDTRQKLCEIERMLSKKRSSSERRNKLRTATTKSSSSEDVSESRVTSTRTRREVVEEDETEAPPSASSASRSRRTASRSASAKSESLRLGDEERDRHSRAQLQELRSAIESQTKELEALKAHFERSKEMTTTENGDEDAQHFISHVRSKVDKLYHNSLSIDRELAEL